MTTNKNNEAYYKVHTIVTVWNVSFAYAIKVELYSTSTLTIFVYIIFSEFLVKRLESGNVWQLQDDGITDRSMVTRHIAPLKLYLQHNKPLSVGKMLRLIAND